MHERAVEIGSTRCRPDEGTLYGEHLWYEGDATKMWRHHVWKRTGDGVIGDVFAAREGFRTDDSSVRDFACALGSVRVRRIGKDRVASR